MGLWWFCELWRFFRKDFGLGFAELGLFCYFVSPGFASGEWLFLAFLNRLQRDYRSILFF